MRRVWVQPYCKHQRRLPRVWCPNRPQSGGSGIMRTLYAFAAVSLLTCMLTATAWWRSMDFTDYVLWNGAFSAEAISTEGELRLVLGSPYVLGEIAGDERLLSHIVHFPRYALRHVDNVVP